MGKQDHPGFTDDRWLSGEDYARLSPFERKRLWAMRKQTRPIRKRQAARSGEAKWEFFELVWKWGIWPVLVVGLLIWSQSGI